MHWRNAILLDHHHPDDSISRSVKRLQQVNERDIFELSPTSSGRKLDRVVVRTMECSSLVRLCPQAIPDVIIRGIEFDFTLAESARLMRVTHRPLLARAPATGQISCNAGGAARLGDICQQLK